MTEIIQLGNPILREIAPSVNDIFTCEVQSLIDNLMEVVKISNGVGIAAPQIGHSCRLFVVASRPNPRYPDAPFVNPFTMINPCIIDHSLEVVEGWEGCLSVYQQRALVPRYQAIAIKYYTREGDLVIKEFTDFIARIIQHELDHLNGILFLDRVKTIG